MKYPAALGNLWASARVRALLTLGIVLGLGTAGTLAAWSDSATATSGTFSIGTLDLRVDDTKELALPALALTGMLPGESVAAQLTAQNRGTIPLTYTMAASTPAGSAALAGYLQISIHPGGAASNAAANGMRTGTCSGTRLAQATLTAGGSTPLVSTARPIAAGTGTDPLCVVAQLTTAAPVAVQNQSVASVRFAFTATAVGQP
ncbi:TasA family protein [Nocardia sp. NPDC057227]|uniref:TasA family protein n=1 Tax=Nocardia sp. NPDC057227 TaxID=3346056 RepID=UPI0036390EC1